MTVYISLLRGINVGGNKKIKMPDLKALYERLGFASVQTLLQSGNVVFTTDQKDAPTLSALIEGAIEGTFGFESKIILRTPDELRHVIQTHPFTEAQLGDPGRALVTFLRDAPEQDSIAALKTYTGPEIFEVKGAELYIYFPDGVGQSKLTNVFIERRLKTVGTARNWNTVQKLLALAEPLESPNMSEN